MKYVRSLNISFLYRCAKLHRLSKVELKGTLSEFLLCLLVKVGTKSTRVLPVETERIIAALKSSVLCNKPAPFKLMSLKVKNLVALLWQEYSGGSDSCFRASS